MRVKERAKLAVHDHVPQMPKRTRAKSHILDAGRVYDLDRLLELHLPQRRIRIHVHLKRCDGRARGDDSSWDRAHSTTLY